MSKENIRPQGAEGISHPCTLAQPPHKSESGNSSSSCPPAFAHLADLLQRVSTDLYQARALFVAIEDRVKDEDGSALGMHIEALGQIGSDISERNGEDLSNTICTLRGYLVAQAHRGAA
ncbi:hypothetical protein KYT87_21390 [Achromobacter sp. ES-001]|uniref:hypothetical protein n=1 Tax=Achromobacter sp. ES-001 TaxID=2860286 RepID=UPI001C6448E7|nr:hypothetical protein [Achromobacter sp. ES-001]QYJ20209.1 hypothetical protein KYT87_21390 [Achromobacter sp. ES-001]